MASIPIYERFYTWQGEGVHMGRAAYFIRTFGCPVHCPWCDSAGTWHPDHVPAKVPRESAVDLAAAAAASGCSIVVITGGEPTIHDLWELTAELKRVHLPVHLETSGGYPLKGSFDWVTVSPKWLKLPLPEVLQAADEIKIIVEEPESIGKWWDQIRTDVRCRSVWLHPEWSVRDDPLVLDAISQWVKTHGDPFRAGWQMHKIYSVE